MFSADANTWLMFIIPYLNKLDLIGYKYKYNNTGILNGKTK